MFDSQRVPLNSRQRQERQGKFPYYGAQGIIDHIDGYIFDGRYILVAEDGENLNSKKLPLALFATGKFWVNNHAHILRGKPNVADDTYLLACLNNADIKPFVTGAAQPKLSQANLRLIEIPLPPVPTQRRIASILSAYDELIENNQRRIRILEEMARSLYREWFVHFRYPGHESVPLVDSPLGQIPQGWEVKKLGDIAEDMRRNIPKGRLDEPQPYVGLEHIPRRSLALDSWEMASELGSNKLKFKKGEVLFGKIRPYFHKVSVAPFDGLCSADTIVIRARQSEHYAIVVGCVSSDEFVAHATATSNGSKMPRANWSVLKEQPIAIPTREVAHQFSAAVDPAIRQMQTLIFQTANLRLTRDLLLPRLLSGQVELATDTPAITA
ncbi:MAG: restriction endonuclease subunit S [Sulfuricella sp.]|nr:restriction endonuclease subunit S [Sulfuricella sp.]